MTRPVAAVLAVVIREGRALLVRRANPPDAGLWGFPGGKIDRGETLATAALRELHEETGVEGGFRQILTALDAIEPDGASHYILIAALCDWVSGDPVAQDDALEAAWFPLNALPAAMSADVAELAELAARFSLQPPAMPPQPPRPARPRPARRG